MLKMNEYLKIKQASEFLGLSVSKLIKMDRDGDLVAYKMRGSQYRLYTQEQLEKFLHSVQDANEFMGMNNEVCNSKCKLCSGRNHEMD